MYEPPMPQQLILEPASLVNDVLHRSCLLSGTGRHKKTISDIMVLYGRIKVGILLIMVVVNKKTRENDKERLPVALHAMLFFGLQASLPDADRLFEARPGRLSRDAGRES
jgi:hypothetical protein